MADCSVSRGLAGVGLVLLSGKSPVLHQLFRGCSYGGLTALLRQTKPGAFHVRCTSHRTATPSPPLRLRAPTQNRSCPPPSSAPAPMYRGLASIDQVCSHQRLRWAWRVVRMVEAQPQVPVASNACSRKFLSPSVVAG
jgi:hypothetical protein